MALWIPFKCSCQRHRQEHNQNNIPNLARNTEPSTDMHIPLLMLDVVLLQLPQPPQYKCMDVVGYRYISLITTVQYICSLTIGKISPEG